MSLYSLNLCDLHESDLEDLKLASDRGTHVVTRTVSLTDGTEIEFQLTINIPTYPGTSDGHICTNCLGSELLEWSREVSS